MQIHMLYNSFTHFCAFRYMYTWHHWHVLMINHVVLQVKLILLLPAVAMDLFVLVAPLLQTFSVVSWTSNTLNSVKLHEASPRVLLVMVLSGVSLRLMFEGVGRMQSKSFIMWDLKFLELHCDLIFNCEQKSEMESEGTMFYEPLHQESFMLELQSLVKYVSHSMYSTNQQYLFFFFNLCSLSIDYKNYFITAMFLQV